MPSLACDSVCCDCRWLLLLLVHLVVGLGRDRMLGLVVAVVLPLPLRIASYLVVSLLLLLLKELRLGFGKNAMSDARVEDAICLYHATAHAQLVSVDATKCCC